MKWLVTEAFVLFHFIFGTCDQIKSKDFGGCHPVYTHGYGYKIYFHLPKNSIKGNNSFLLIFSVQATSDAHILLTTSPNPKDHDPVYEIVLGAGGNTFSEIRRLNKNSFRSSNFTKNVLSKDEEKMFWIQFINGAISVGEEGLTKPFLSYTDSSSLVIKYMSFSSWFGTTARWQFDCLGATATPQNRTISQRLQNYLFSNYDAYAVPIADDDTVLVETNLTINYVSLDTSSFLMDLRGRLRMAWSDPKLQWSPSDYGNISVLRSTERRVWQPALILLNGASLNQKWFDEGITTFNFEGSVIWTTSVHIQTRCNLSMDDWPSDQHSCFIEIGLDSGQDNVHLPGFKDVVMGNDMSSGHWQLLHIKGTEIFSTYLQWDQPLESSMPQELKSLLNIEVSFRRFSSAYYHLFYVPLKVTMLMSVISVCLPYSCRHRIILQVIVLIAFVINMLSISSSLPRFINATPKILSLNCWVFFVSLISTLLTVWLMQFAKSGNHLSGSKIITIMEKCFGKIKPLFQNQSLVGKKLLNLEEEDEATSSTHVTNKCQPEEEQALQKCLNIFDHIILSAVLFSYSVLLLVF